MTVIEPHVDYGQVLSEKRSVEVDTETAAGCLAGGYIAVD